MNKTWLLLLLLCSSLSLRAQSISIADMMNIVNLPEDEAKGYLTSKGFKLKIISTENGFQVEQFELTQHGKQETVIYGRNRKAVDGTILHNLRYSTNTEAYITSIIKTAPHSGLHLDFQGADHYKNVYFYDSSLFRAGIYLNFNHAYGLVEITEKDLSGG